MTTKPKKEESEMDPSGPEELKAFKIEKNNEIKRLLKENGKLKAKNDTLLIKYESEKSRADDLSKQVTLTSKQSRIFINVAKPVDGSHSDK